MTVHAIAAQGFGSAADAYDRGRPDYPAEAIACLIDQLHITPAATVVDLGAGTGKLTELLVPSGARIIAIEPVAAMRRKLVERLPHVTALEGTAEAIPLPDASADAVVAAQAFHWFSTPAALQEIHRVLKPDGRLGLLWNVRDDRVDWVADLTVMLDEHERKIPRYRTGEWRQVFVGTTLFTPLHEHQFTHRQAGDLALMMDRMASIAFIATLPPAERNAFLERVRHLLTTHPSLRGREPIVFPYRTELYWCTKR
jgi:SAM-dependent methyltransferase